jgi:D-aminopeptidase
MMIRLPAEHRATPAGKPRARALGLPFAGRPGRWNAVTDVPGVEVGYVTLIAGDQVRTGVTALHPRGQAAADDPVAAGFHAQNGNGEMTGVSWINESGTFAGPVALTNTHAVGPAHAGIIAWTVRHHPWLAEGWLLPVAAETWDGYLNDINGHHVTEDTAVAALEAARSGPVEEGSVGGGTGMNCYQFKGGSGTASRLVPFAGAQYTVGRGQRPGGERGDDRPGRPPHPGAAPRPDHRVTGPDRAHNAMRGEPNSATGLSQHTARSHACPNPSRASPASCRA